MHIEARFRRRAQVGESVPDLVRALLASLSGIEGLWKEGAPTGDAIFDAGQGESAAVDLSPCLVRGLRGAVSYASRVPGAVVDKAIADDVLVLQIDNEAMDFQSLCRQTFARLVEAFLPYRAAVITDLDLDLDDFESIAQEAQRTGRDVDGRDTVYRIHPVNYFDDLMCVRAFGVDAAELVARLQGKIEFAQSICSGALLVVVAEAVQGEQLASLDSRVRELAALA
jgi:hypothetical protein